jgi:hypothetical protein
MEGGIANCRKRNEVDTFMIFILRKKLGKEVRSLNDRELDGHKCYAEK